MVERFKVINNRVRIDMHLGLRLPLPIIMVITASKLHCNVTGTGSILTIFLLFVSTNTYYRPVFLTLIWVGHIHTHSRLFNMEV